MNTRECTLLKKEKSNNYECSGSQKMQNGDTWLIVKDMKVISSEECKQHKKQCKNHPA